MARAGHYRFLWGDYQALYSIPANIDAFRNHKEIIWNQVSNIIQVSRKNTFVTSHSRADLAQDLERGKAYLDEGFARHAIRAIQETFDRQLALFAKTAETDVSILTHDELSVLFAELMDRWGIAISYFRGTQAEGTQALIQTLKQAFSAEEVSLLLLPPEPDLAMLEQAAWRALPRDADDDALWEHAARYPWTVMCHFTREDVLETLRRRLTHDPGRPLEDRSALKQKQDALCARHPEMARHVSLLQRLVLSRMEIKHCWAGTDFFLLPLAEEVARRRGERAGDILQYYLPDEMEALAKGGKSVPREEKERRDRCFVGLWKDGAATYASGEEAEELAAAELGTLEEEDAGELRGTAANGGRVRGRVCLLLANDVTQNREARKRFRQGDILVTQMTQPNVMDVASKAAAIVTDEGGMLSHAAIISRELGIPCVVGTERATRALKDGDLVEVDADQGIVRRTKS